MHRNSHVDTICSYPDPQEDPTSRTPNCGRQFPFGLDYRALRYRGAFESARRGGKPREKCSAALGRPVKTAKLPFGDM